MSRAAPRCRTLTAARLDRDADLDRDYAAVATALHYDVGVPADEAIARARETFRPGETVRDWWDRATTDTERTAKRRAPTPLMGHEPYERKANVSTRRTRAPTIRKPYFGKTVWNNHVSGTHRGARTAWREGRLHQSHRDLVTRGLPSVGRRDGAQETCQGTERPAFRDLAGGRCAASQAAGLTDEVGALCRAGSRQPVAVP